MKKEFNVNQVRRDFPNLNVQVNGRPVVYLDNGASTFKPQSVIDAVTNHYTHETSNVHRGVHYLSEKATLAFESVRGKVQSFLNAEHENEIIFTKGTTDSINLVANGYADILKEGDEIIITQMEHHSNIVPWQLLEQRLGFNFIKVAPINDDGEIILEDFEALLSEKTKLVSVVHISNSLGTINPIKDIIQKAHTLGAKVLVDAAQSVSHSAIDVQDFDCDFLAFSGHKLFGPTGVGVLYGKQDALNELSPYQGGGDMIKNVVLPRGTTFNSLPHKFEAGTPNIAGVIGLGAGIEYLNQYDFNQIAQYKDELQQYLTEQLLSIDGVRIIGTAQNKAPICSFLLGDIHAHDLGTILNEQAVAVRTGHHCTEPVMKHFGITATTRASLSIYNTKEEVDLLVSAINQAKSIFDV